MTHYINKDALVAKLKNIMRKKFRIVWNELSKEGLKAFHPLRYRIEQRYTLLFFIHWWDAPMFAPPHNFEFVRDAVKHIKEHFPNAIIYDGYSDNNINNRYYGTIH